MRSLVLIGVILQVGWSYAKGYSDGVGAFSYQDSSGKRYGGTYGLKDGEVVDAKGTFPPNFTPPTDFIPPNFEDNFIGFFPEYFRNFKNLLQDPGFPYYAPQIPQYISSSPTHSYSGWPEHNIPDYGSFNNIPNYSTVSNYIPNYGYDNNINRAFQSNLDSQRLALDAAHKAFDLTSNQAGLLHNLNPSRFPSFNNRFADIPNMPEPQFPSGFPFSGGIPDFSKNSNTAFAEASVGPDSSHQVAAINPGNPQSPNVYKSGPGSDNPGGYKSVSVSSYSSSSDINGKKTSSQGADTMINDNGHISSYHVHNP